MPLFKQVYMVYGIHLYLLYLTQCEIDGVAEQKMQQVINIIVDISVKANLYHCKARVLASITLILRNKY